MSRELSAVLNVDDPITQAYSLEISSPGINRPLRTAAHFAHFAGSVAKIQLAIPMQLEAGERRNFKGVLRGMTGERADKVGDRGRWPTFELPLADINQAKLVPDWDAVMRQRIRCGRTDESKTCQAGPPPVAEAPEGALGEHNGGQN